MADPNLTFTFGTDSQPVDENPVGFDPNVPDMAFAARASQQPQQLPPDATEMQWISQYNDHLLLTVQAFRILQQVLIARLL